MMLLSPHLSVVPLAAVTPFVITVPPIPGESLLGFVSRSLSHTAIKRLVTGLSLAGIGSLKPTSIPSTLSDAGQIAGLATLLGTTDDEITSRLIPPTLINGSSAYDFHGTLIRAKYRETRFRRVSPIALAASNHYRSIWNVRPLGFDPDSLEPLVDTCPVCNRKLDWLRALGISKCNHCVDDRGIPQIDLRDFPQTPIETDDREALVLAANLVSPDAETRAAAFSKMPAPWNDHSPAEIFDTIVVTASILSAENRSVPTTRVWRPGVDDFDILTPSELSAAGRMIIDGTKGIADILRSVRAKRNERPAHESRFAAFGAFAYIGQDTGLSSDVKQAFESAMLRELGARPVGRKLKWDDVLQDGRIDLRQISIEYGVTIKRLLRLVEAGLIPHSVGGHRSMAVRVRPEDIRPIMAELTLAEDEHGMAAMLGVSPGCLGVLEERGLVSRASDPTCLVLGPTRQYLRKSASDLLDRVHNEVPVGDVAREQTATTLLAGSQRHRERWGAALAAIVTCDLNIIRTPLCTDWRNDVGILDSAAFFAALDQVAATCEAIDIPTAANIIDTNLPMIGRLTRAGHLKRLPGPVTKFSRGEVERFARQYVLGKEAAQKLGYRSARGIRELMLAQGVRPALQIPDRSELVFLRSEIAAVTARLS